MTIEIPKKKTLIQKIALGVLALLSAAVIAILGGQVDWVATGKDALKGEASNSVQALEDYKVTD